MTKFLSMIPALALAISALASAAFAGNPTVSARLTTGVVKLGSDVGLALDAGPGWMPEALHSAIPSHDSPGPRTANQHTSKNEPSPQAGGHDRSHRS